MANGNIIRQPNGSLSPDLWQASSDGAQLYLAAHPTASGPLAEILGGTNVTVRSSDGVTAVAATGRITVNKSAIYRLWINLPIASSAAASGNVTIDTLINGAAPASHTPALPNLTLTRLGAIAGVAAPEFGLVCDYQLNAGEFVEVAITGAGGGGIITVTGAISLDFVRDLTPADPA